MTINKFQTMLDEHGAIIKLWPLKELWKARMLLVVSSEARKRLATAKTIHRHLTKPVRAPAGLSDRILQAALGADEASRQSIQVAKNLAKPEPAKSVKDPHLKGLVSQLWL